MTWQTLFVVFLCGFGLFVVSVEPVDILPWWTGVIGAVVFMSTIPVAVALDLRERRGGR